jgi:hypothetical protein
MSAPVPATAVSICNRALARLGISYTIQALTDASKEAYQCNLWFVPCREATLQDIPWGFATKRATLALSGTGQATAPWTYKYAYPNDCLMARSIDLGVIITDPKQRIPFAIESDGTESGRVILCDFPNAVLTYTLAITNPAMFTTRFADALAWKLAEDLAMVMSVSTVIRDGVHAHYELALSRAIMADNREQQDRMEPDAEFIQGRL